MIHKYNSLRLKLFVFFVFSYLNLELWITTNNLVVMMKTLSPLLFLLFIFQLGFAQGQVVDREKLLDLYQTQRYAEAASYLKSIYSSEMNDVKALGQIAYCDMMAGKLVDAEQSYLKINELQPGKLPILFSLANINSRRGNKARATDYLQQIIKLDSNNFNAYKQLAGYTDSTELRLNYLKRANQLNTTEADVAYDLAILYHKIKLSLPAYNVLKTAIAADTGNFILQQSLLPIANQLKKYNEVVVIGEMLLKNGGDANVVRDLGRAYFFLKAYIKTIKLYQMLERVSMQNETTLYYTTLSYSALKNHEMAATYAKKTIEEGISPNISAYYNVLGGIYEERNQLSAASAAYKKGLTFTSNKNIYYRLALLYDLKLKQPKNALTYYQLYLKSKDLEEEDQPQIVYVKSRLAQFKKQP